MLYHVGWWASLSFSFVQVSERAGVWINVLSHYTESSALDVVNKIPFREDLTEYFIFIVTNFSSLLPNVKCPSITDSANWMLICAALIHRSLKRLAGQLRAETCKPIQWGCWVCNKSGKNSYWLTFICHFSFYCHAKKVWLLATIKWAVSEWVNNFKVRLGLICSFFFMTVIMEPFAVITLRLKIIIYS